MAMITNGDNLYVGNINIATESYSFTKKDFNKSFSFSCELEPSADLTKLFGSDNDKVDIIYKVSGTMRRTYPRYPRKMKKALKKLTLPDQRMTRRMNKLMR